MEGFEINDVVMSGGSVVVSWDMYTEFDAPALEGEWALYVEYDATTSNYWSQASISGWGRGSDRCDGVTIFSVFHGRLDHQ